MNGLGVLLRKELLGQHRTGRLWLSLALFAMVGLASPLLTSLLPELLSRIPEEQLGGVEILLLQEPGLTDALAQYHKNMTMLPLLLVLVAMGAVASERRGSAVLVLSRGAGRGAFLVSKLLALLGTAALGTAVAAGCFAFYASVLYSTPEPAGFLALNGLYLALYLDVLALTLLGGVLGRGQGAAAAAGLGGFLLMSVLAALPSVARWTPAGLLTLAGELIEGRVPSGPAPVLGALALALAATWGAHRVFSRQEL